NELEGVITSPLTNSQFTMVITNDMSSQSLLPGTPVIVKLNGAETYFVDPKDLGIASSGVIGFQSQADIVLGHTVLVQAGTFAGINTSITNPTRLLLRYSS